MADMGRVPHIELEIDLLCLEYLLNLSALAAGPRKPGCLVPSVGSTVCAYALWQRAVKYNPHDPAWPDRDRLFFEGAQNWPLLPALCFLVGCKTSFAAGGERQLGDPGWEKVLEGDYSSMRTGRGSGPEVAVGRAMEEASMAARFNRPGHTVVDYRTYLLSDQRIEEVISSPAVLEAGQRKLGKLTMIHDCDAAYAKEPGRRPLRLLDTELAEMGWQMLCVRGWELGAISGAMERAAKETARPSLIAVCRGTEGPDFPARSAGGIRGMGSSYAAAGDYEAVAVPEEVSRHFHTAVERGILAQAEWQVRFHAYSKIYPELAEEFDRERLGATGGSSQPDR